MEMYIEMCAVKLDVAVVTGFVFSLVVALTDIEAACLICFVSDNGSVCHVALSSFENGKAPAQFYDCDEA